MKTNIQTFPYPHRRSIEANRFDRRLEAWLRRSARGPEPALRTKAALESVRSWENSRPSSDDLDRSNAFLTPGTPVGERLAIARAVAEEHTGLRAHEEQIAGAIGLLRGRVIEMDTGEGKSLTAAIAAACAAATHPSVHVVTVNDYLVRRDAAQFSPFFETLGLSVGTVVESSSADERRRSYRQNVTYVSNKQVAFDFLRDRATLGDRTPARVAVETLQSGDPRQALLLSGLCFAIVDEADSILIDEARTPLILSGASNEEGLDEELCAAALEIADTLSKGEDFEIEADTRRVQISGPARIRAETLAVQARRESPGLRVDPHVLQALAALHAYERDRDYVVVDGKVDIVDEFTGRRMPDRSWEHGLHQMIETHEGLEVSGAPRTLARTSYQRFFRRYLHLSGMTGTAREARSELRSVYELEVQRIPNHHTSQRQNLGSRGFATRDKKWQAIIDRTRELHQAGRPLLLGTRSVAASEELSQWLTAAGLEHQILNARQDADEASLIARAGRAGRITVATNMAGRGTDIALDESARRNGGLHVIATELHEASRIDRQLHGRCARQGDPGSFETFFSLEDDLLRQHARSSFATRIGGQKSWSRIAGRAQHRAEKRHAVARARLAQSEEQLSKALSFAGSDD